MPKNCSIYFDINWAVSNIAQYVYLWTLISQFRNCHKNFQIFSHCLGSLEISQDFPNIFTLIVHFSFLTIRYRKFEQLPINVECLLQAFYFDRALFISNYSGIGNFYNYTITQSMWNAYSQDFTLIGHFSFLTILA